MVRKPREQKLEEVSTEEPKLEEKVVEINRITRVVAGGRRFRFRATVVVGDKNGHVGIGVAKASEVTSAISKAATFARKTMIEVPVYRTTIPTEIQVKYGGALVFLKPASPGTGIIAGGAVRAVVELAGIKDILSKILNSTNKVNNVKATFLALKRLKELQVLKNKKGQHETASVKTEV